MQLNHIHLAGSDAKQLEEFYGRWFGFRRTMVEGETIFLKDEGGFLMAVDAVEGHVPLPKWFHVGFCLADPQAVRDLHARMKSAGVPMAKELNEWPGEAVVFYAIDPAQNRVEVSWYA